MILKSVHAEMGTHSRLSWAHCRQQGCRQPQPRLMRQPSQPRPQPRSPRLWQCRPWPSWHRSSFRRQRRWQRHHRRPPRQSRRGRRLWRLWRSCWRGGRASAWPQACLFLRIRHCRLLCPRRSLEERLLLLLLIFWSIQLFLLAA